MELRFEFDEQQGGTLGSLSLCCSFCRSGDDPWPRMEFLIFDIPPEFPQETAKRFADFAAR